MRFEAVFFDLYGTLLVYGDMTAAWSSWLRTLHRWFDMLGLDIDSKELATRCDGFFSRPPPELDPDGLTVYERRLEELVRELGAEASDEQLQSIAPATIEAWQEFVDLDPDAHSVLEQLAQTHPLALITNFDHPPHVQKILDETRLNRHFASVVVSGDLGIKKPDPSIFDPAIAAVGLAARNIAYIGDAPEDIVAAHGAGMTPIRLQRDGDTEGDKAADFRHAKVPRQWTRDIEHLTISSLRELPALVADA
jgi:HAD superfamily hydrolase (TIGR01549 family)